MEGRAFRVDAVNFDKGSVSLDVDEKSHEPEQEEEPDEDAPCRPSVLAALEEKSDKPEPVKPFRSYYDKDGDAR